MLIWVNRRKLFDNSIIWQIRRQSVKSVVEKQSQFNGRTQNTEVRRQKEKIENKPNFKLGKIA
jgi:hypothetical protein